jgi:hypothetical protein
MSAQITVRCKCGNILKGEVVKIYRSPYIEVAPCNACMEDARNDGIEEGLQTA